MSSVDAGSQSESYATFPTSPPPHSSTDGLDPARPPADGSAAVVDPNLIQQTKNQIRSLVNEIARLAQSDCSVEEFYDGFLTRVTGALASVGGAVWTVDDDGQLRLQYQINLSQTRLSESEADQARHTLLLKKVAAAGESVLVPPQSGSADDDEAGNPTDFLLVLGVIQVEQTAHSIVEIFQRSGSGPTTQRGYLRFLVQMCDLAGDFLKNRRLRQLADRQSLWDQVEQFIGRVHASLDPSDTSYAVVNEGRRLIQADRVSVALRRGGRWRVEAVSGLDSIERRAAQIKSLGRLTSVAVAAGEPLWYSGATDELPPQVEQVLHRYLDKSHAKMIAIVPLVPPVEDEDKAPDKPAAAIGALIVENLSDSRWTGGFEQRVETVARHSAAALSNALEHNRLFLLPLWRALGKSRCVVAARNLPTTLLVLVALGLGVTALFVTPADFDVSSDGTLLPSVRKEIYAPIDGVLLDVTVPDDADGIVDAGQTLAILENRDLEAEIGVLEGRKKETQEQVAAVNQMLLSDDLRMTPVDEYRLDGQLKQLRATAQSIDEQLLLLRKKQAQLRITSPARGQVVTWQVRENLLRRPVNRGQRLMTVADPEGDWELELHVPERRLGHLIEADREATDELGVTFILATHPGAEFEGRVVEIDRTAEVRGDEGNTVLVRVAIDRTKLPDVRAGAQVTAKIHCGRRSLGYVLFQDLIETVQTKVLFWF